MTLSRRPKPGPSRQVREGCWNRAGGRCERCERSLAMFPYSLHHRRARGMGGTIRPETNLPANLLYLCGSATTPGSCHEWTEQHREQARAEGLLVRQTALPALIPVLLLRGWVLLTDDFRFVDSAPAA